MAKGIDKKYAAGRLDGLAWALRIVEARGIDGLREEIAFRKAIPVQFELDIEASKKYLKDYGKLMYGFLSSVFYSTLNDKFGFGEARLKRVENLVKEKCLELSEVDHYGYRYLQISDLAKELNEKYGLTIGIEDVEEVDKMNERTLPVYRASIKAIAELLEQNGCHEGKKILMDFLPEAFGEVSDD